MNEKTLLEYLNSLHEETSVTINILINGCYRLITVNEAKELLCCLSHGVLATRDYYCEPYVYSDFEFTEIFIRELA